MEAEFLSKITIALLCAIFPIFWKVIRAQSKMQEEMTANRNARQLNALEVRNIRSQTDKIEKWIEGGGMAPEDQARQLERDTERKAILQALKRHETKIDLLQTELHEIRQYLPKGRQ